MFRAVQCFLEVHPKTGSLGEFVYPSQDSKLEHDGKLAYWSANQYKQVSKGPRLGMTRARYNYACSLPPYLEIHETCSVQRLWDQQQQAINIARNKANQF